MTDANFPIAETTFSADRVTPPSLTAGEIFAINLHTVPQQLLTGCQNSVIYSYGQKVLKKRQFLFGTSRVTEGLNAESGVAQHLLHSLFQSPVGEAVFKVQACVLGVNDDIVDLLDLENASAVMSDSVKEGPVLLNLTKREIRSYAEAVAALRTVAKNVQEEYADVMAESCETDPFPPYNPSTCLLGVLKYPNREAAESGQDDNSVYFVSLGDSERPPLCGINSEHVSKYEKTHKAHTALISVLGAIRCNRLRVPFTKSKLALLLRRAYNQEKSNPQSDVNRPTKSFLFAFVFGDDSHAEETLHTLTVVKRISNISSSSAVGPASRDLTAERWRLEQDILELKDELTIAKAVHDYRPCIYDQAKPVQNIQEEEHRRIAATVKKREEARAKAQAEMRAQAQKEAEVIIRAEEEKSHNNLQQLEETLKARLAQNAELEAERERKTKEFDRQLEKIRKKKVEEEEKAAKLREEIRAIEEELGARQAAIQKAQQQLDLLNQDRTHGRELIMRGREEAKVHRQKVDQQRKAQREQWLADIEATNLKVLEQVRLLAKERAAAGIGRISNEDVSEREVARDIDAIREFLPSLLDLDDPRPETPASEKIRLQLEEYFRTEKQNFEQKLADEEQRKKELEKAAEVYRARLHEYQARVRQDQLQEAVRKERHLEGLTEQVIQYLEHGCQLTKIPSKGSARKRYYFIGDDRKKLCCCELDEAQNVAARRKASTVFLFKDFRRIILGQFTPQFDHFGRGGRKGPDLDDEEGAYNPNSTEIITPQNVGKYFYRSFSIELRKGKTLDVVADTDSDFEAWIVALRRLLGARADWEKVLDDKRGAAADPPPTIDWGEPLVVAGRPGAERLSKDELQLCARHHVTPAQYLAAKAEVLARAQAQSGFVTVYDVRTLSSLDLLRSKEVYDYFVAKKLIPKWTDQSE